MADPKKYSCEVCNHANFLISKFEVVNGKGVLTTDCYYCESKFCVEKDALHLLINKRTVVSTKQEHNNVVTGDKVPITTYIIFGLLGVGIFCFIIQAVSNHNEQQVSNVNQSVQQKAPNYHADLTSSGNFEVIASIFVTLLSIYFAFKLIKNSFNK